MSCRASVRISRHPPELYRFGIVSRLVVVILLYCSRRLRLVFGRNDSSLASDGKRECSGCRERHRSIEGHFIQGSSESPLNDSLYQASPVSSYCTLTFGMMGELQC
jgi:hypothetical protein